MNNENSRRGRELYECSKRALAMRAIGLCCLLSLVFVAQRHNQHINWDIVNQLARR